MPFSIIGSKVFDCQHGPDRKKAFKARQANEKVCFCSIKVTFCLCLFVCFLALCYFFLTTGWWSLLQKEEIFNSRHHEIWAHCKYSSIRSYYISKLQGKQWSLLLLFLSSFLKFILFNQNMFRMNHNPSLSSSKQQSASQKPAVLNESGDSQKEAREEYNCTSGSSQLKKIISMVEYSHPGQRMA